MPDPSALIDDVYIKPIKSVLFIDDSFPSYCDLISGADETVAVGSQEEALEGLQGLEEDEQLTQREVKIVEQVDENAFNSEDNRVSCSRINFLAQSSRRNGYIFDIENNFSRILDDQNGNTYLNKPDLIILDYYLREHGDGFEAQQIISRLHNSDRFNLVIVHTTETPTVAATEIAISLRGLKADTLSAGCKRRTGGDSGGDRLGEYVLEYLSDADRFDIENWKTKLSWPMATQEDVISRFEAYITSKFSTPASLASRGTIISCGVGEGTHPWVCTDNVFVVVVQKTTSPDEESVELILDGLRKALLEYSPQPISLVVQHAINTIKNQGNSIITDSFSDSRTRAALLYYIMSKGSSSSADFGEALKFKIAEFTQRTLDTLSYGLQKSTGAFMASLLEHLAEEVAGSTCQAVAIRKEKAPKSTPELELHLKANVFLCSHARSRNFMTTGFVFLDSAKPDNAWLCVSPACDLVPGRDSGDKYRKKIAPANYFEALRLTRLKGHADISSAIADATHGRHIFIEHKGTVYVFDAFQGSGACLSPFVFYALNGGYISPDDIIELSLVGTEQAAEPDTKRLAISTIRAQVIGQLRSEYAHRLLAQKGAWNSRVGVDFVSS